MGFGFGGLLPKEVTDALDAMSDDMAEVKDQLKQLDEVKNYLKELVEIQTEMWNMARQVHGYDLEKRPA
jgi:GTP1/Obg family GTP-binding protein